MIRTFIDRETELSMLGRAHAKTGFQFYILYGRRRIGKTELIKEFIKDKRALYFLCDQQGTRKNVERMASLASQELDLPRLASDDFHELFEGILKLAGTGERLVVAIDEFPYLVERDEAIPSIFQRLVDEVLSHSSIFLILCGSSVAMMEASTLSPTSPLHGRRTGQIKVKTMSFKAAIRFFPGYTMKDLVLVHAILGGMPAYLSKFDPALNLADNVSSTILQKDQVLYEEPEHLLRQELREPRQYMAILQALAKGNTRVSDIAGATGIAAKDLPAYLSVLIKLEIVDKLQPVTESRPTSKRSLYRIKDDFLRFWFRFVYPHKALLEMGKVEEVMLHVQANLNHHASLAFENTCREFLLESGVIPGEFTRAGTWWEKGTEIDIVCLDQRAGIIVFGECKWSDGVDGHAIAKALKDKASRVSWKDGSRDEHHVVFARGFHPGVPRDDGTRYIDLETMARFFKVGHVR